MKTMLQIVLNLEETISLKGMHSHKKRALKKSNNLGSFGSKSNEKSWKVILFGSRRRPFTNSSTAVHR